MREPKNQMLGTMEPPGLTQFKSVNNNQFKGGYGHSNMHIFHF